MSIPSLEDRLRAIEDRLAIYTLIASHPPSADTAAANYTREVYVEDGVFDRGPKLEGAYGVDAIASFTLKPEHKEAIQGGTCSHSWPASHRSTRRSGHRNLLSPDPLLGSSGRTTRTAQPRRFAGLPHSSCLREPLATGQNQRRMDDQDSHDPAHRRFF